VTFEVSKEGSNARKYFIRETGRSPGTPTQVPFAEQEVVAWKRMLASLERPYQRNSPEGVVEPFHVSFATVAAAGEIVMVELVDGQMCCWPMRVDGSKVQVSGEMMMLSVRPSLGSQDLMTAARMASNSQGLGYWPVSVSCEACNVVEQVHIPRSFMTAWGQYHCMRIWLY
jgi:hypothetical protein